MPKTPAKRVSDHYQRSRQAGLVTYKRMMPPEFIPIMDEYLQNLRKHPPK